MEPEIDVIAGHIEPHVLDKSGNLTWALYVTTQPFINILLKRTENTETSERCYWQCVAKDMKTYPIIAANACTLGANSRAGSIQFRLNKCDKNYQEANVQRQYSPHCLYSGIVPVPNVVMGCVVEVVVVVEGVVDVPVVINSTASQILEPAKQSAPFQTCMYVQRLD
jgi:hypothetical protein